MHVLIAFSIQYILILLLIFAQITNNQIICYNCISRIDINSVSKVEQDALRSALFSRYNVPPSHENCGDGRTGLLFRTVNQEKCPSVNDTCIRISFEDASKSHSQRVVLRGCKSTIFKIGFELDSSLSCENSKNSDCIALCNTTLCNTSPKSISFLIPSLLVIFRILIR